MAMQRKSAPTKALKVRRKARRNPADRWALSLYCRSGIADTDPLVRYILHGTLPKWNSGTWSEREDAKKDTAVLLRVAEKAAGSTAADTREAGRDLAALLPSNLSTVRLNPRGALQTIVVAWVIPDGAREEVHGEWERSWDSSHYVPKTRAVPRAMTAMWLNQGTAADVKKAKQYLVTDRPPEGSTLGAVFTYPVTEKEPLVRAKRDILAAFAKKRRATKRRSS